MGKPVVIPDNVKIEKCPDGYAYGGEQSLSRKMGEFNPKSVDGNLWVSRRGRANWTSKHNFWEDV